MSAKAFAVFRATVGFNCDSKNVKLIFVRLGYGTFDSCQTCAQVLTAVKPAAKFTKLKIREWKKVTFKPTNQI